MGVSVIFFCWITFETHLRKEKREERLEDSAADLSGGEEAGEVNRERARARKKWVAMRPCWWKCDESNRIHTYRTFSARPRMYSDALRLRVWRLDIFRLV